MRRSARTRSQKRADKCRLLRKDKEQMKDQKNITKIIDNNRMQLPSMLASSSGQKGQKKNQKMKNFEESDAFIPFAQKHQEEITRTGVKLPIQPATEEKSVAKKMPDKSLLESVIDILQRTDRHDSFAQPIDANVVEGYYDIIKNPMDFGTMRAKLQEGLYTSMEEFEHDVFLVSNNAMLFNATATMYFRQARAIHELAKRVLHALKTDLKKFEDEFCLTKKPNKKPTRRESSRLASKSRASRDAENFKESFIQMHERSNQLPASFSQYESIFSVFAGSEKQLVLGNGGIGYEESLQMFVQGLGPIAKKVAARRLACLNENITNSQCLLDDIEQDTNRDDRVKGKAPVIIDIDNSKQTDWLGLSVPNNSCYSEVKNTKMTSHPSGSIEPTIWMRPANEIDPKSVAKLNSSSPFEYSSPVSQMGVPSAPRGLHDFQWGPGPSNAWMGQDSPQNVCASRAKTARVLQDFPWGTTPQNALAHVHLAQEHNRHSVINPTPPPQQFRNNINHPSSSRQILTLQNQDTFLMPSLDHKGKYHLINKHE